MLNRLLRKYVRMGLGMLAAGLFAMQANAQSADIQAIASSLSPAQAAQARSIAATMSPQQIQEAAGKLGGAKPAAPPPQPAPAKTGEQPPPASERAVAEPVKELQGFASHTSAQPFGQQLLVGQGGGHTLDIPVPGDYQIGPGDTVLLQLFGKDNRSYSLPVTRDGYIQVPELGPVVVSGLTFEEMSRLVIERIGKQKIGIDVSISMGPLRSIQVFLLGDVRSPGAYTVPALTTLGNALLTAGGVRPNGSLRRIELRRGGKTLTRFDLYDVLLKGDARTDLRLQPSDVIFVPPVGKRVAIEGDVNRPAIYELLNETTAADLLQLAGGLLPTAFPDATKLQRVRSDDAREVVSVSLGGGKARQIKLTDGDILTVPASLQAVRGSVELVGAVQRPGPYSWREGMTVAQLLPSFGLLKPGAWRLLVLVERTNSVTGLRQYLATDLVRTQRGQPSLALNEGDRVVVFERDDVEFLASPMLQAALQGKPAGTCAAVDELANIVKVEGVERFRSVVAKEPPAGAGTRCPAVFADAPQLLYAALEHTVGIRGEVQRPGFVLIAPGVTLADAIEASGGLTRTANPDNIELSGSLVVAGRTQTKRQTLALASAAAQQLVSGDTVQVRKRFNELDNGVVTVAGEVASPGVFDIRRGERLSEVLLRAGGLTANAYPYGAVFQRVRVKEAKRAFYQRAGIEMQNAVLLMTARQKRTAAAAGDATVFQAMRSLADEMKQVEPSGRVVVEADPTVLQVRPDLDVVLEPGDVIEVPKRPSHVIVMGEVLNPGALQFRSGQRAGDYLRSAGGVAQTGDETRTFMILPNGSAEPLKVSSWNEQPTPIPPGSVIYVPRDPLPLDNTALFQTVLEIAKDVALTAASLYSITK